MHEPDELVIDEVVRFEGTSDPGDAAVLFAVRCETHGTMGTYLVAYGPSVDPLDAQMIHRLADGRRR